MFSFTDPSRSGSGHSTFSSSFGRPRPICSSFKEPVTPAKESSRTTKAFVSPFATGRSIPAEGMRDVSEEEEEEDEEEEGDVFTYALQNAPIATGRLRDWQDRGRTLKFRLSPLHSDGIAWIDEKRVDGGSEAHAAPEEMKIFPAEIPDSALSDEYLKFVKDAHELYRALSEADQIGGAIDPSENILPKYATTFLQILDVARRRIFDERLSEAYVVCHCLFASYFVDPAITRAEAIMDWLNQSDPRPTTEETSDIMTTAVPYNEPGFWEMVNKLALRGLFYQCSNCLKEADMPYSDSQSKEALQTATSILETAPKGAKAFEGHRKWRAHAIAFGEQCTKLADTNLRKGLIILANILRGDTDTILTLSESWQEVTAALFLFHDPAPSRLSEYYHMAVAQFPVDFTVISEAGCAAVIAGDIPKALSILERLDVCVAAHIADFCDRQRMLDDFYNIETLDLPPFRDWLFMAHGITCCATAGTWFIGATYLKDTEGTQGLSIIRESITHVYPDNEATLSELLEICKDLQFESEAQEIVIAWSKLQLSRNQVGSAMEWLDSIGNSLEMRAITWQLLESTLLNGLTLPDTILQRFLVSPRLCPGMIREFIAPYATYFAFKNHLNEGDVVEAAQSLASLLQFGFLPGRFFGALLGELLPLLDRSQPRTLPTSELIAIMNSLYQWEKDPQKYTEGVRFLAKTLDAARQATELADDDWRVEHVNVPSKEVIKLVRSKLVSEVSRAYLEEL
ncbi:Nup85 nucleoporin-domain-containing protein [Lipomyces kononenkoae]|uniref:Nup85 nucleoporin-domain-containing protein n=1 Tax=Lipomyces kononenkoae TaxID=34357 RepID=A0ACC3TBJ6_LIPKO